MKISESIYDIGVTTMAGEEITLEKYKGKTILIVNTASKCGYTKQFDGLQELYEAYKDKGFVILGFPSNNFLHQDPGSNKEILQFCKLNYGVTFPMFEKISVKGEGMHPLYVYLTSEVSDPDFAGKITWNFNKFLISKDGQIIDRFKSGDRPMDSKITNAVVKAIGQ
ncbi:MAG: glutathione peroxidase [Kiritimatiellae bacterium]|nr:glutathione peroxidase [Kiritimatiellia bacterium]